MDRPHMPLIGFACAYTPLPLIAAAGFTPFRVLPLTRGPGPGRQPPARQPLPPRQVDPGPRHGGRSSAACGNGLHEQLRRHAPPLRRLADAPRRRAPAVLIDLPVTADELSVRFLRRRTQTHGRNPGRRGVARTLTPDRIRRGIAEYNALAGLLEALAERVNRGMLADGPARLQAAFNRAATSPFAETAAADPGIPRRPNGDGDPDAVPLYLFGNVLPDPEAFRLFAACGARIAASDLCSGTRLFQTLDVGTGERSPAGTWPRPSLRRPCARTFDPDHPPASRTISSRRPGPPASGASSATR